MGPEATMKLPPENDALPAEARVPFLGAGDSPTRDAPVGNNTAGRITSWNCTATVAAASYGGQNRTPDRAEPA